MVRRRSERVEREARRKRKAVSLILTLIITRRRRKRRRRLEPKASRKAGPQSQVKLKIPIPGGRGERVLPLSLPPLQGEQPHQCDQHLLQAGHAVAEIRRRRRVVSRDRSLTSQLRRES